MAKDFDRWNTKKKRLHADETLPYYHEREIWWCALGVNIGFEQDGTGTNFDRPIIVLKGFNRNTCLAIAVTGKRKSGKYYFYLGKIEERDATAILSQIRLVDAKRFIRKIGTLDEKTFTQLQQALKDMLFPENSLPSLARGRGRSHM